MWEMGVVLVSEMGSKINIEAIDGAGWRLESVLRSITNYERFMCSKPGWAGHGEESP